MMHTASHIRSALSIRCVLKITVFPRARSSTTVSLSACALIGSRPENGSSRITSSGSWISVPMNCTFCCMPRDSSSIFAKPQSFSAVFSWNRSIHSSMRCSATLPGTPFNSARNRSTRRTCIFLYSPRSSGR